jgi:hypothetical protein
MRGGKSVPRCAHSVRISIHARIASAYARIASADGFRWTFLIALLLMILQGTLTARVKVVQVLLLLFELWLVLFFLFYLRLLILLLDVD